MDKATKTKIILFASLGIFVLVVLAVTLALTGKGDNREEDGSVNTSLRAQQQSDFTLDDMMNTDGRPEYENFTDEVYRERSGAMYREDPEVIALQEQLSRPLTCYSKRCMDTHRPQQLLSSVGTRNSSYK